MLPTERRIGEQRDNSLQAVLNEAKTEFGVSFHFTTLDTIKKAQRYTERDGGNLTAVGLFQTIGYFDPEIYDVVRNADVHPRTPTPNESFAGTPYPSLTRSTLGISEDTTLCLRRAAQLARDTGSGKVNTLHLLKALSENPEVVDALSSDEGAVNRLRTEIELYEGQLELGDKLHLLVEGRRMHRDVRKALLRDLKRAFNKAADSQRVVAKLTKKP